MKCRRCGTSRDLIFSDLPALHDGTVLPPELEVALTYRGDTGVGNAQALDDIVIPAIVAAFTRPVSADPQTGWKYYQCDYELRNGDDEVLTRGALLFRAPNRVAAARRTVDCVLAEHKDVADRDPYVAVTRVTFAEEPETQQPTRYALFALDEDGQAGEAIYFCDTECQTEFLKLGKLPAHWQSWTEGTGNDYGVHGRCKQCGCDLEDRTNGVSGKVPDAVDSAVMTLVDHGFTGVILDYYERNADETVYLLPAVMDERSSEYLMPGTVEYQVSDGPDGARAYSEDFLSWRDAAIRFAEIKTRGWALPARKPAKRSGKSKPK